MSSYIFDLETNGLIDQVTKIHCAVLVDVDTGEVFDFRGHEAPKFLKMLSDADMIIGHNCINYDIPVILKLYPDWKFEKSRVRDTMIMARLLFPDVKSSDFPRHKAWKHQEAADKHYASLLAEGIAEGSAWKTAWARHMMLRSQDGLRPLAKDERAPEFPAKLIGSHSLQAWGIRLGNHKDDYSGSWDEWNPEMHSYMIQDGRVTRDLYKFLMTRANSEQALELEHRVAWLCSQIERNGFPFNVKAAEKLYSTLAAERESLRLELVNLFPNWKVRLPDFIPARNNKTKGYVAGVPVERWKEYEFNPASREHIADRLTDKYGWKPTEFTESGKPKIDDEVLAKLPFLEAKKLARFFLVEKRIGQLAEGNQAWLRVQKNGKIHARYTTNGAVTGRATHSYPNISQVPRVSSEYGRDCRALFHVPEGWEQVGIDQSGLELRCLASDMAHFDGGSYAKIVCEGDVHTENQQAAGLETRDQAKTFIYAFLYGAGNDKIGAIAKGNSSRGKLLRETFLKKTPALKKLIDAVKAGAKKGWISGIDGRRIPIRSEHAALNTRLQSSGAIICKQWIADFEDALLAMGLKHGWDGDFVFLSWSHDEVQVAVRKGLGLIFSETITDEKGKQKQRVWGPLADAARLTGREAGKPFGFRCPLDVDIKVGSNWAECH